MIVIQNLCKQFEDKVLFDNYNCTIPDGGFVVFAVKVAVEKQPCLI